MTGASITPQPHLAQFADTGGGPPGERVRYPPGAPPELYFSLGPGIRRRGTDFYDEDTLKLAFGWRDHPPTTKGGERHR